MLLEIQKTRYWSRDQLINSLQMYGIELSRRAKNRPVEYLRLALIDKMIDEEVSNLETLKRERG